MLSKQKIGERIKACRETNNEKQTDLAKLLNVQRQIVSYYETGARTPNIEDLAMLAEHFNTSVDYLLGLSDVKCQNVELKAVCDYTGLSEEAIRTIKTYCDITKRTEETIIILDSNFDKLTFSEPKFVFEIFNFLISNSSFWESIAAAANYNVSLTDWVKDVSEFIKNDLTGLIDNSKDTSYFSVEDLTESELLALFNKISEFINQKQRLVKCNFFESVEFFKKSIEEFTEELKIKQNKEKNILNSVENVIGIKLYELKGVEDNGEHN